MTNAAGTTRRPTGARAGRRPMIGSEEVRALADRHGEPAVSTVYLDVDGRRRPAPDHYRTAFEALADRLRRRARVSGDGDLAAAVEADVTTMRQWLENDFQRSGTRGLAMFANNATKWFRAIELPEVVRDQIGLGPTPRVDQLVAMLEAADELLVALVDRRKLRIVGCAAGVVRELAGLDEPLPRGIDSSTERGVFTRHTEEVVRSHYRHAATELERIAAAHPGAGIALGGTDAGVAGLTAQLHEPIASRVVGRISLSLSATADDVVDAVEALRDDIAHRHATDVAARLAERTTSDDRAVYGLGPTLESLTDKRVGQLVVAAGFAAAGAVCDTCGHLDVAVGRCGRCGNDQTEVDDVVELAVERALAQHATVEYLFTDDLDALGGIGAFERF